MMLTSELIATLQLLMQVNGDRLCYLSDGNLVEQILVEKDILPFPEDKHFTIYSEGDDIPE